jgi:hypothetical protein
MAENTSKSTSKNTGERAASTYEEALEVGFLGVEADPTPNENYTFQGQVAGKPTPETDEKAADAARKAAGLR